MFSSMATTGLHSGYQLPMQWMYSPPDLSMHGPQLVAPHPSSLQQTLLTWFWAVFASEQSNQHSSHQTLPHS